MYVPACRRFARAILILVFFGSISVVASFPNIFQEAKKFSKNCFKPGAHSEYFLKSLGKFTRLAISDFQKSFGCEPKMIKFELICEESNSNTYIEYAGGENPDDYWYYGFKVDSVNEETVTLSNFVRSKDPLKVCEELGVEVTLENKEIEVSGTMTAQIKEKPKFETIKFENPENSNKINTKLSEIDQKNAEALLTTEIPENNAPDSGKPWKIQTQVKPIVQKTQTFYSMGGLGMRPSFVSNFENEEQENNPASEMNDFLMQGPHMAHLDMSSWMTNFHNAWAKQAEQLHRNNFQQLIDSLGSDRVDNWKSVKKGGSEKTIMTVLNESKNSFLTMDRMLSEIDPSSQNQEHVLKFIPFDGKAVKDLDAVLR